MFIFIMIFSNSQLISIEMIKVSNTRNVKWKIFDTSQKYFVQDRYHKRYHKSRCDIIRVRNCDFRSNLRIPIWYWIQSKFSWWLIQVAFSQFSVPKRSEKSRSSLWIWCDVTKEEGCGKWQQTSKWSTVWYPEWFI